MKTTHFQKDYSTAGRESVEGPKLRVDVYDVLVTVDVTKFLAT